MRLCQTFPATMIALSLIALAHAQRSPSPTSPASPAGPGLGAFQGLPGQARLWLLALDTAPEATVRARLEQELDRKTGVQTQDVTVAANSISHKLFKREIPNSTMLGAFARIAPHIIEVGQLRNEARHVFSELLGADLVDRNLQAIQHGHDLCHIG